MPGRKPACDDIAVRSLVDGFGRRSGRITDEKPRLCPALAGGDHAALPLDVGDEDGPRTGLAHEHLDHRLATLNETATEDLLLVLAREPSHRRVARQAELLCAGWE